MSTPRYTLTANLRDILRDGQPFATLYRHLAAETDDPRCTELDAFARAVVDRMNASTDARGALAIAVDVLRQYGDYSDVMARELGRGFRPTGPKGETIEHCTTIVEAARNAVGTDAVALDTIAAALDGTEWNADTLDQVASAVRSTGRPVRDAKDDAR